MKLLEVKGLYFWVASAEIRRQPLSTGIAEKLHDLSWRIADKLREMDQVEFLDEILTILFSDAFPSVTARSAALDSLIANIGRLTNPRYSKAIAEVSEANWRSLSENPERPSNAPGRIAHW